MASPETLEDLQALKTLLASLLELGDLRRAVGAIAEEIYILRLRSILGPAKAFALIYGVILYLLWTDRTPFL